MDHLQRDHGGGLDAAVAIYGGVRAGWLDLSTGINPVAYPVGAISAGAWAALPDQAAMQRLEKAARHFWPVPAAAAVLAVPGASAAIAMVPFLADPARVCIVGPTYNEHEAAFQAAGWVVTQGAAEAVVAVHPNNPDGRRWQAADIDARLAVIDESFCDVIPGESLIGQAARPGCVVLKSFGKFWGLAGLRLGFAIGDPVVLAGLAQRIGPWPVSGPALEIGARALEDGVWAEKTRVRLQQDAARLDRMIGAPLVGGTGLFRLYRVADAAHWQQALARAHIWSRVFPYNPEWLRLGLPGSPPDWARLAHALQGMR